ncbi:MAG TPA: putative lipid II flippase FtsW [Verrucomicrobiae bacterium]|nr:putative lipid II flippase FtsW [Verrucomicrobiae bacterium]
MNIKYAATILVFCVTALLSLGLVILFSSSMDKNGQNYPAMQAVWCGLGVVAAVLVAWIDYRHLKKISLVLYVAAVVLLVLVLIPGIGVKVGGARRWLHVAGQSLQPSEIAKIAVVILLAHYGERYQRFMAAPIRGLIIPGILICIVLGLIFREPDWGTTLLLAAVGVVMLLVAGVRWRYLVVPAVAGCIAFAFVLLNNETRLNRVKSWMDPEATKGGVGYQSWQGMVALGSGGVRGLGLGDSRQKFGYLPEHETDFIFAIIGEELGLAGTIGVVVAFMVVMICGVRIGWNARDAFGMLLATGLTFLIGLQAFINIGVVTGTLPNKGLPLPFISRGGSNLFLMLMCVGLLLSIARRAGDSRSTMPRSVDLEELPAPQTT